MTDKASTFEELGIEVKHGKNEYLTVCPNCSHTRKKENQKKECLKVWNYEGKKTWNCIHCGWSGGLSLYDKFKEVYKASRRPAELQKLFSRELTIWLESRGISVKTALDCRCYEVRGKDGYPEIAFPYYFQHTLRNVMFRRVNEVQANTYGKTYQVSKDKGTETIFWGLDELDFSKDTGEDYIIITEGQPDRLTWVECGYKNVLSVPMGAPDPKTKNVEKRMEYINDEFRRLLHDGGKTRGRRIRIYVAVDEDENGRFLRTLLGEMLGKDRCWNINCPTGYKDSNEVFAGHNEKALKALGKEGVDNMFSSAQAFKLKGIINIYDVQSEIENISRYGHQRGLIAGIPEIDEYLSIKRKILVAITGIPGMAKSTFVRWWITELSKKNDINWGMYTPENRPPSREYAKLVECYGRNLLYNKYDHKLSMSSVQKEKAFAWVHRHITIINPDTKSFETFGEKIVKPKTIKSVFEYFKYLKETVGIYGFVIDAWNKLDHERPAGMTETDYISQQLDTVLEFLDVNDMCGIIIAHPAKQERQKGGNFEVPTLYDIKGSSAWFEKVDIGISVHRTKYKNLNQGQRGAVENWVLDKHAPTQIFIQKMKFDELGQEGKIEMWLDRAKGDIFKFDSPYPKEETKEQSDDLPFG